MLIEQLKNEEKLSKKIPSKGNITKRKYNKLLKSANKLNISKERLKQLIKKINEENYLPDEKNKGVIINRIIKVGGLVIGVLAIVLIVVVSFKYFDKNNTSNKLDGEKNKNISLTNFKEINIEKHFVGQLDGKIMKLQIFNKNKQYFDYNIILGMDTILYRKKGKIDYDNNNIIFIKTEHDNEDEKRMIDSLGESIISINSINKIKITSKNNKWNLIEH